MIRLVFCSFFHCHAPLCLFFFSFVSVFVFLCSAVFVFLSFGCWVPFLSVSLLCLYYIPRLSFFHRCVFESPLFGFVSFCLSFFLSFFFFVVSLFLSFFLSLSLCVFFFFLLYQGHSWLGFGLVLGSLALVVLVGCE